MSLFNIQLASFGESDLFDGLLSQFLHVILVKSICSVACDMLKMIERLLWMQLKLTIFMQ